MSQAVKDDRPDILIVDDTPANIRLLEADLGGTLFRRLARGLVR